ncbi:MAG: phosphate-starvation-inducible PsiE family protein [Methanobacteriota archaeon]
MTDNHELQTAILIKYLRVVPVIIYIVVAFFLTIAAIFSLGITLFDIITMITTPNWEDGIIQIIKAILLTVIIVELFETVIVYLRTKRVPVRAILIAGLTGMIRHVIIFNVSTAQPIEIIGPAVMLAVLIAGVFLLREEGDSGHNNF